MIKWFEDITEDDFDLVGGKAYNLAKLYRQGMQVPNGFVILSTAYDAYAGQTPLDENLLREINDSFDRLASEYVAVRSSSTVEDLPGLSFAGQYSTYLDVSRDDLENKIIKCWKSLNNERAVDYRQKNNIVEGYSHAVVIQEMLDAYVSGVAFTSNPINGVRDEVVINSAFGLGEAIVSGEKTPDQYIVHKKTGQLIESNIVESSLTESMIKEVVDIANKLTSFFGQAQDIEFSFNKKGKLFLLQSRDITTLFPLDSFEKDDKFRAYLAASTVMLGMKEAFTPLGFSVMSHMYPSIINIMTGRKKKAIDNKFVKHSAYRMYVDMTYLMSSEFVAKQFAKAFSGNDLPLKGVMDNVIDLYGRRFKKQGYRFKIPFGVLKYALSFTGPLLEINKIPNDKRYEVMRQLADEAYDAQLKVFNALTGDEERIAFSREVLIEAFVLSQSMSMYCLDVNNLVKIEKILHKHLPGQYHAEKLVQSLPECVTQRMMLDLNHYARTLDEGGLRVSVEHPEFQDILKKYGHRGNIELDIGTKRWREDPSYLVSLVESYMVDQMYERNLKDYKEKRLEAEEMIEDIYNDLTAMGKKRLARKTKTLMVNYRYGAAMREYPKSAIVKFMELGRKALLEVGGNLVKVGKLETDSDIFFLYEEEILSDLPLKERVKEHKNSYHKEMKRRSIPRMVLSNGATFYTSTVIDPSSDTLKGLALSPGAYEGVIRIVVDPKNSELKEGEILVTESTNPAWTPLFATAGALIMEYGGPMSHGGIVAREYGIPAVVGIPSATNLLKDGQRVRVDGGTGVIELL